MKIHTNHNTDNERHVYCKTQGVIRALAMLLPLLLVMPSVVQADQTAPCNDSGSESTECGVNAETTTGQSTAVGNEAIVSGFNSTALGHRAVATAAQAIALGTESRAGSANTTALGFAAGFNGFTSNTDSPASIAIGSFANIIRNSPGAIAIGGSDGPFDASTRGAQSRGKNAIAIGFEARATQPGAIALGANVKANKANTMTVGIPIEVNEISAGNKVKTLFNLVCTTCTPGFRFSQILPSNNIWNFRMLQSGNFSVDDPATIPKEAEFRSGGDLKIGGALIQASSRAIKNNIKALPSEDILTKLDQLEISEWSYKKDKGKVRHIGPMAEDFYELFDVGVDNKSISSIDAAGVALAAIKALNKQNIIKDKEISALQEQLDSQAHELAVLKAKIAMLIHE